MKPPPAEPAARCRWAITVRGVVQGVGFRPFVYNAARSRGLTGWVQNHSGAVQIEAEGTPAALDEFLDALRHAHPPQARIDAIEVQPIAWPDAAPGRRPSAAGFAIRASLDAAAPQPTVPADLATCDLCLAEIRDPAQRRYRYPFTNCTNCGPRWSIIRQLPYDRPRTSMAAFAMCPECAAEYADPADRRFHAQPIACPRCGPALELLDGRGRPRRRAAEALDWPAAPCWPAACVAMKGLGGFQLLVDATNAAAVGLLRRRKRRPDRPFAVMFPSLDDSAAAAASCRRPRPARWRSPEAPILLLRRQRRRPHGDRRGGGPRAIPYLGVMLPYTPLHHLLLEAVGRPVVCTSGNLSEEPMAIDTADALHRWAAVGATARGPRASPTCCWSTTGRSSARWTIRWPGCDAEGLQVLRRARGYAPLPIELARCRADDRWPSAGI